MLLSYISHHLDPKKAEFSWNAVKFIRNAKNKEEAEDITSFGGWKNALNHSLGC
jgi:hypothetical protein